MAGPSHMRYHAGAFAIGIIVFALGWALDRVADIGAGIDGYTAAYLMPFQLALGIVLTVLLGLMSGRHGAMAIWHACLWMGGGVALGWLFWTAYAIGVGV